RTPGVTYAPLVGVRYFNTGWGRGVGAASGLGYRGGVDGFGGGESVGLRLLGSYLKERSNTNSVGVKTELQGALGAPEWTAMLTGNYNRGPLSVSMTTRYTDSMLINRNWNHNGSSTQWDVFDNTVRSEVLVDARVTYAFDTANGNL